jgi:phosphate transport system substrate-binding protein
MKKIVAVLLLAVASFSVSAQQITGAGATFPYPIYSAWASAYNKETGVRLNYQSIGSGGGVRQILANTVNFGATDDPMLGPDLEKNNLFQFPAVIGGTVPIVNIPGVKPGELKLTGTLIADIYLGKIKKWDDPAIQSLNPSVKLPSNDIIVTYRSDGSGTTFGWTNYLAKVSSEWKEKFGTGSKAIKWPTGQGGKGNEGVAAMVKQIKNSIGYVEYIYAKNNGLAWTQLQNAAGKFVQPEARAFAAAAANANWDSEPGMGVVLTNQPGDASWPVTSATFILMYKEPKNVNDAKQAIKFFEWVFTNGDKMALDLEYIPLPKDVKDKIRKGWAQYTLQ